MKSLSGVASLVVATVVAMSAPGAAAQDKPENFPERPLRIIVPYGAGGGSDQLSRAMGEALQQVIDTPVQIVNKPGGGGLAALPDFMAAPKDGYTILESIDAAVTNYASNKMDMNPAKDWWPLAIAQITFNQLYIRPDDNRFSNFQEFAAYAKDHPGELTVANVGNKGSMERVNMLLLQRELGFETKQIAFDKPSKRYAAVIGGQIDALFEQPGDVKQFLEAGKLEPIVTFFDERPDAFSDVPTTQEVGADFTPLLRFRGFWTHPDVPDARKRYLEAKIEEAWNTEQFQEFNRSKFMHLVDSYRGHEGTKKLLNNAVETYIDVYKQIGLR